MAVLASPRGLHLAALAATAILASAFVIGQATGPGNDQAGANPDPAPVAAPVPAGSDAPDPDLVPPLPTSPAPSATQADPPATQADPPAETPPAADDLPEYAPLAVDRSGPHGTRRTSGSAAVALTFDDGPHPVYTQQTLDVLRQYGVKATFCLVGRNAETYPELVAAIAADGHTLCNHSWSHDFDLGSLPLESIRADLTRTSAAIRAAAPGHPVSYFRQPGGFWSPAVVEVARELGMTPVHWSIDPADYYQPGAGSITATVTAQAVPGSIVLLHDAGGNRTGTVLALRSILPNLRQRFLVDALPPMAESAEQRSRRLHLHLGQI
ncbi:polysaccharide deacetylase family protein [Micromonospora sp. LOL_023]|uniref:polysaccharide deacetylase family protein n=1 Tax=Micromonospora sp. LOL_023 TaxID=3345418 RepID=UPI003A86A795